MIDKKLIHFLNYDDFKNRKNEIPDDSITFIKSTLQIYTHGLLYSCSDKLVNELTDLIASKANTEDLSNVLATEILDEDSVELFDKLIREEVKKDLFIDLWNEACGNFGKYNANTGYFELNGLTDITYEQAIRIYNSPLGIGYKCAKYPNNIRTNLPPTFESAYMTNGDLIMYCNFRANTTIEVANIQTASISSGLSAFSGCTNLRRIEGLLILSMCTDIRWIFDKCYELEYVQINRNKRDISLEHCSKIGLYSISYLVSRSENESAITITVHPDVYAKLTDKTNTDWYLVLIDASAKNISFASA